MNPISLQFELVAVRNVLPLTSTAGQKIPALGLNALDRRLEHLYDLCRNPFGKPPLHLGYYHLARQAAGDHNRGPFDIGCRSSGIVDLTERDFEPVTGIKIDMFGQIRTCVAFPVSSFCHVVNRTSPVNNPANNRVPKSLLRTLE